MATISIVKLSPPKAIRLLLVLAILLPAVVKSQRMPMALKTAATEAPQHPASLAHYYYYPDIQVYYNAWAHQFVYIENSAWVASNSAPTLYANYDYQNNHVIVITDSHFAPWKDHYSFFPQYPIRYFRYGSKIAHTPVQHKPVYVRKPTEPIKQYANDVQKAKRTIHSGYAQHQGNKHLYHGSGNRSDVNTAALITVYAPHEEIDANTIVGNEPGVDGHRYGEHPITMKQPRVEGFGLK